VTLLLPQTTADGLCRIKNIHQIACYVKKKFWSKDQDRPNMILLDEQKLCKTTFTDSFKLVAPVYLWLQ
jgi:hypothetical protein